MKQVVIFIDTQVTPDRGVDIEQGMRARLAELGVDHTDAAVLYDRTSKAVAPWSVPQPSVFHDVLARRSFQQ